MGPRSARKQVGEGARVQVCSTRLCTCTWHLKAVLALSRPGPQSTANCWFDGSWHIQKHHTQGPLGPGSRAGWMRRGPERCGRGPRLVLSPSPAGRSEPGSCLGFVILETPKVLTPCPQLTCLQPVEEVQTAGGACNRWRLSGQEAALGPRRGPSLCSVCGTPRRAQAVPHVVSPLVSWKSLLMSDSSFPWNSRRRRAVVAHRSSLEPVPPLPCGGLGVQPAQLPGLWPGALTASFLGHPHPSSWQVGSHPLSGEAQAGVGALGRIFFL